MGSNRSDHIDADRIPAGYVRKAHGIRGDVVVRGLVDDADDRFKTGTMLTTGESPARMMRVVSSRMAASDYLLHLDGVESRNEAESLVGVQFVIAKDDRRPLESEEWWIEDLIGCDVTDLDGDHVGVVRGVVSGAAQDRLVVESREGVLAEIPFVSELVPEVDLEGQLITVNLPEGLIE